MIDSAITVVEFQFISYEDDLCERSLIFCAEIIKKQGNAFLAYELTSRTDISNQFN